MGEGLKFDLIVLDEASQVAETLTLVPLMCMGPRSRLVLAGVSKEDSFHKTRSVSLMERWCTEVDDAGDVAGTAIPTLCPLKRARATVVFLSRQYRMPKMVCMLVSKAYYIRLASDETMTLRFALSGKTDAIKGSRFVPLTHEP